MVAIGVDDFSFASAAVNRFQPLDLAHPAIAR
jgi:hypothetical protein